MASVPYRSLSIILIPSCETSRRTNAYTRIYNLWFSTTRVRAHGLVDTVTKLQSISYAAVQPFEVLDSRAVEVAKKREIYLRVAGLGKKQQLRVYKAFYVIYHLRLFSSNAL